MTTELWEQDNFGKEHKCILPLEYKNMNYPYPICKLCYTGVSLFCASVNSAHVAYAGGTFCISCRPATIRWHTLVYVVIRRTYPKNFVHAQNFQRLPTY